MFNMLLHSAFLFFCIFIAVGSTKPPPTVYLIRHGEKPANRHKHGLTLDGIRRAQCLRGVFGADSKYDIGHIMAPTVKWSESIPCNKTKQLKGGWIGVIVVTDEPGGLII